MWLASTIYWTKYTSFMTLALDIDIVFVWKLEIFFFLPYSYQEKASMTIQLPLYCVINVIQEGIQMRRCFFGFDGYRDLYTTHFDAVWRHRVNKSCDGSLFSNFISEDFPAWNILSDIQDILIFMPLCFDRQIAVKI